ncbi:hypothetical protein FEM48_Zijuj03G0006000 [Ziziphus jujuba var. spinosa]|uniref:Protein kinase domain-containing protein n=1 Tax=Ziziphus jujuba var. spinosa TaxID=714518 RepID=A0A978VM65_ZIZJJ|nr:hypothetical protein FEM48_Zijuj03G0006000 [Ziziphus jujuba var. spinosa]
MTTKEAQRVVVIQDASKDVSSRALKGVLESLSLQQGDELILLAVLHQVNNPSTLSLFAAGKRHMGYKIKADSKTSSMFGTNQKIIEEECSKKEMEYHNNEDFAEISQQCEREEIEFHIEVLPGSSPKQDALERAKRLYPSWVILDREMKKHKKYFLERLSCGISRVKRDNSIEILREPKSIEISKPPTERSSKEPNERSTKRHVKYDEMIPGSPEKKSSPKKGKTSADKEQSERSDGSPFHNNRKHTSATATSSSEQLTARGSSASVGNNESTSSVFTDSRKFEAEEMGKEKSSSSIAENQERGPKEGGNAGSPDEQKQNRNSSWMEGYQTDEDIENAICSKCRNRRPKIGWKKDFTYAELQAATDNFSQKNFLSEGGFGSVYKGELNGLKIAVKQHKKHTRKPLSWEMRMKIAFGAAKGLQYLHKNNIIHRDMRPNNILVTHDYETMLGDFGLARTQCDDTDHSSETRVVGTLGYLAPEYAESGRVSTKTDVYAYGIILLQLITGLRPTDKSLQGKSLVGWARPLLKERNYPDLIDPRIIDSHDFHQLFWMVQIAEKCLCKDPHKRVTMDRIVSALRLLMESNTSCSVIEISPAHSDSAFSVPDADSSETRGEEVNSACIETTSLYGSCLAETSPGGLSPSPPSSSQSPSSGSSSIDRVSGTSSLDSRQDDYLYNKDLAA